MSDHERADHAIPSIPIRDTRPSEDIARVGRAFGHCDEAMTVLGNLLKDNTVTGGDRTQVVRALAQLTRVWFYLAVNLGCDECRVPGRGYFAAKGHCLPDRIHQYAVGADGARHA